MICLGRKGKVADISKVRMRRGKSLFLNGILLGSICTGIQVKLVNHCQAVMIKQQITFKLQGLILSQGQLAKGP